MTPPGHYGGPLGRIPLQVQPPTPLEIDLAAYRSGSGNGIRDLGLQTGESAPLARVRVTKGGSLDLGMPGDGSPAHHQLMRQFYPFVPILPTRTPDVRPVVYGWDIGSIAASGTSLSNALKISRPSDIAAFAFGTFDPTTGIYTKNRSVFDFYRNNNFHLASVDIGNNNTVKGVSDLLLGNNLDRILPLLDPWSVTASQALGLDVWNRNTANSVYHDAIAYALESYECPELPPGDYTLFMGVIRIATTDFDSAGVYASGQFTFQGAPAWMIALAGHIEAGNLAITHTALSHKVTEFQSSSGYAIVGGNDQWIPDQLVYGAQGQRPLVFPRPLYVAQNSVLALDLNNNIDATPAAVNYEYYVYYLARDLASGSTGG